MFELKKSDHFEGGYELVRGNIHYGVSCPQTDTQFLKMLLDMAEAVALQLADDELRALQPADGSQ